MKKNRIYNVDYKYVKNIPENAVDYVITAIPFYKIQEYKDNNYYDFLFQVFSESLRVAKKNVVVVLPNTKKTLENNINIMSFYSNSIKELIVWNRIVSKRTYNIKKLNDFDFVLCFKKNENTTKLEHQNIITTQTKEINITQNKTDFDRTVLFEYLINHFTEPDELILDMFSSRGDLAVICKENSRNFLSFEEDKELYEKSIKRINQIPKQKKIF